MRVRSVVGALCSTVLLSAGCSSPKEPETFTDAGATPLSTLASDAAHSRVRQLRARFAVLRGGVVDRFELVDHRMRPIFAASPERRDTTAAAKIELPEQASGPVAIADEQSHLGVQFVLERSQPSRVEVVDGVAIYRAAHDGADIVHRVGVDGTEDFLAYDEKPAREMLEYRVDVSRVQGLRLVSNTVEFLDDAGTPRLRIAPPYVVDAAGKHTAATLTIDGCAHDTNPAPPWGRRVTAPGATSCVVRVTWSGVEYPALVDPSWTTTGSMSAIRTEHTATLLNTGKILIAGGGWTSAWQTADLYDPTTGTMAATGNLQTTRRAHTATLLNSGLVLLAGGVNAGTGLISFGELYDPSTGTFTKTTGSLAAQRFMHRATLLTSGKVLLVGGSTGGSALTAAELFDPTAGTFTATGSMAVGRQVHTSTLLPSGKVLVTGGITTGAITGPATTTMELYDPTAGTFAATGSMTVERVRHTATLLPSGKVLLAGSAGTTTELYDPSTGTSTASAPVLQQREFASATLLASGKVLFAGGQAGFVFDTAEVFDPISGSVPTAKMTVARDQHTATLLSTGKVFVVGGANYMPGELFGQLTTGTACDGSGDCASGFCVDGYCCNSACTSNCQACNIAGALGTCSNSPKAKAVGSRTCGNYFCSGTAPDCPTSCTADTDCNPSLAWCNAGACVPLRANGAACPTGNHECGSHQCADGTCCNTACTAQCEACDVSPVQGTCTAVVGAPHTGHAACGASTACVTAQCDGASRTTCAGTAFVASGTPCGSAVCDKTQLVSQSCDGAGTCTASSVGTECAPFLCTAGACTTSCTTNTDCAADAFCKAGVCKKKQANGSTCEGGTECSSGFCIDSFCCNSACAGQCEACDAKGAEGTCAAIAGAPHGGRSACPTGDSMQPCKAALCDGVARGSCGGFVGSAVTCRAAACEGRQLLPGAACDGKGNCPAAAAIDCGAYACDASAGQCKLTCASDSDCSEGQRCSNARCVSGATCKDDHTSVSADGKAEDCTPYACDTTGSCAKKCTSTANCVSGAVCDLGTGQCVQSAPPGEDSGGGCAVTERAPTRSTAFGLLFAAAALAYRRRRSVRTSSGRTDG